VRRSELEVERKVPFIAFPTDRPEGRYVGQRRRKAKKRSKRSNPNNPVVVSEVQATHIRLGDFAIFPVIPEHNRVCAPLRADVIEQHARGCPNTDRIYELPVNRALAYAYGLWIAYSNHTVDILNPQSA